MTVFERDAVTLTRAETRTHVQVLRFTLFDRDDHHFVARRHVRIFQTHRNTRKDTQRRQALFRFAHQTAPIQLAFRERDAAANQALAGHARPTNHDARHTHGFALADHEA